MEGRNASSGLLICILVFLGAGLFMTLGFNADFFFFAPFFPAIFIFIICIIAIGAASSNRSRQRRNDPYRYSYYYQNRNLQQQTPVENPYKVKPIEIIDESPKIEEEKTMEVQFCMYCGVKIDRDAAYCHQCGTKLK
ncbi:MAG: zinc-ribbon domain-containing protein [Promethearchaeota archaeon]